MSDSDQFRTMARLLMDKYMEAMVRAETLRILLVTKGVFSEDEFQAAFQQLKKPWDDRLAELRQNAATEDMRRMLEEFEGPKQ